MQLLDCISSKELLNLGVDKQVNHSMMAHFNMMLGNNFYVGNNGVVMKGNLI